MALTRKHSKQNDKGKLDKKTPSNKLSYTKFVSFVKITELCTHYAISISYKYIRPAL